MADINIPGVSDKYKTNDLVNSLIELEKVPLKREQQRLESYKLEKECLQRVNQYMTSVRDSARGLFSYNNPFTDKNVVSSQEDSLTAEATRDAAAGTYKVEVLQVAAADKFLSNQLPKDFSVQPGKYTFKVGTKTVSFNWKGGTVNDFVDVLNKRSKDILKASLVGYSNDEKILSIESLLTGSENTLSFEDDALSLAAGTGIIRLGGSSNTVTLLKSTRELSSVSQLTSDKVALKSAILSVPPQNGVAVKIPESALDNLEKYLTMKVKFSDVQDMTENEKAVEVSAPVLPEPGTVEFAGITISNAQMDTDLPFVEPEKTQKVETNSVVYIKKANGTEVALSALRPDEEGNAYVKFKLSEVPEISSIEIKNFNTGKSLAVSNIQIRDVQADRGMTPLNPVSTAADACVKYEGITMTRSSNKIDDIIPNITLNLENESKKPVTLTVETDNDNIKSSIIEFVGNYNRLMAELNILTQTKEEIVNEIEYFTDDERSDAMKRLGLFQADFTLTSNKQVLQSTMSAAYKIESNEKIRMLSQIGIASKTGTASGINASQLRGYLEIDEKKLDTALQENLAEIKNLFGYDSDNDLVTDTGIAYLVDKNLQAYTQTGGIIATKNSGLDSKVKSSEAQIKKLETQIAEKEKELKQKYSAMESTLNSLESQSNSITNFNNQNSKNKN